MALKLFHLEGGIMLLGLHTSDMTVAEMGELIDYMEAKGAELGVVFDSGRDAAGDNLAACAA